MLALIVTLWSDSSLEHESNFASAVWTILICLSIGSSEDVISPLRSHAPLPPLTAYVKHADELVAGFTVEFKFFTSILRAVMHGWSFSKEFAMLHHPPP